MTPFANATTPAKTALGTALAFGAGAVFLLVASNVLLGSGAPQTSPEETLQRLCTC